MIDLPNSYPRATNLPSVTTEQMIEVDRRMIDEVGIILFQMMENAGLQLANVARDLFLGGDVAGKRIAVLAGAGGNGGGAIVAARRLVNWGANCDIGLSHSVDELTKVPQAQFSILEKISRVNRIDAPDLNSGYDLIIDGLIGYSLNGDPHGKAAEYIKSANESGIPILSLDVPSGYDGSKGVVRQPCIRASATMTLALPKVGMTDEDNAANVGTLLCADISCPDVVYADLGLDMAYASPFSKAPVVGVE